MKLPADRRVPSSGTSPEHGNGALESSLENAWESEVLSRIREIREGKVILVPWEEAKKRIFEDE